jgi:hypothetical protein
MYGNSMIYIDITGGNAMQWLYGMNPVGIQLYINIRYQIKHQGMLCMGIQWYIVMIWFETGGIAM